MTNLASQNVGPITPAVFASAVQALVFLHRAGDTCPSAQLAGQIGAHAVFLRRILAMLVRANLVTAREGREGGYRLARAPAEITFADIHRALQAPSDVGSSSFVPMRGPTLEPGVRMLFHEIAAQTEAAAQHILARYTLAEVLARSEQSGAQEQHACDP